MGLCVLAITSGWHKRGISFYLVRRVVIITSFAG
jgi:hypothetical protein